MGENVGQMDRVICSFIQEKHSKEVVLIIEVSGRFLKL